MSTRRPADPVQVVHVSAALLREWTESYRAPGGAIDEAKDELKRLVKLARECEDSDRVHVLADLACVGERVVVLRDGASRGAETWRLVERKLASLVGPLRLRVEGAS